jgi:hypothetical protein
MNFLRTKFFPVWFFTSSVFWLIAAGQSRAVTFICTPAAVPNNYGGVITLNIGGLSSGESVKVQTFLDLNGNGVVDPGEPLIDVFGLTDGQVPKIGSVTNINVPFDSNAAAGTITAAFGYCIPLDEVVGHRIFEVVSPTNHFAPVTATLNVTNAALGQYIGGTVYNGSTPVPNVMVLALTSPDGNFGGAALADASGHYQLSLNPGSYNLIGTAPGYYANEGMAPLVALTNGVPVTANLFLSNAPVTVSGQVYNSVNSNGIGGLLVECQFKGEMLTSFAFTDTNGVYTAPATSNAWTFKAESTRLIRRALVASQDKTTGDASSGSVTNVNIAVFPADACFYGRATISSTSPFPNLHVEADNSDASLKAEGFADLNGDYVVAVRGTNSGWADSLSGDNPALTNYITSEGTNATLVPGATVRCDFNALPATATLSGRLESPSGQPVAGVAIFANTTINNSFYDAPQVLTDLNGNYSMGLVAGQWSVVANCCGDNGLDGAGYYDSTPMHLVTVPPNNPVLNITVFPIGAAVLSQGSHSAPSFFSFSLNGAAGSNYSVQASTNLGGTNWFTITNLPSFIGQALIQDNHATNGQRFYRAVLVP